MGQLMSLGLHIPTLPFFPGKHNFFLTQGKASSDRSCEQAGHEHPDSVPRIPRKLLFCNTLGNRDFLLFSRRGKLWKITGKNQQQTHKVTTPTEKFLWFFFFHFILRDSRVILKLESGNPSKNK